MLKTAHASANKTLETLAIDAFIGSPAASLDDCVLVEFEVKRYHRDGSRDQPASFACGSPSCPRREMSGVLELLGVQDANPHYGSMPFSMASRLAATLRRPAASSDCSEKAASRSFHSFRSSSSDVLAARPPRSC